MKARNRTIVAAELAARGGHCIHPGCTSTKIEWHHRDPTTKTLEISSWPGGAKRLYDELLKCEPLCKPHHDEAHAAIIPNLKAEVARLRSEIERLKARR